MQSFVSQAKLWGLFVVNNIQKHVEASYSAESGHLVRQNQNLDKVCKCLTRSRILETELCNLKKKINPYSSYTTILFSLFWIWILKCAGDDREGAWGGEVSNPLK